MTNKQRLISQVYINIDGSDVSTAIMDNLISMEVDDNLNLPDTFTMRIRDSQLKWIDSDVFALGKSVLISAEGDSGISKLMQGEITGIEPCFNQDTGATLTIRGYDKCHRLNREKKTRSFNQMTDGDIATKIAREFNLKPKVDPTKEVHAYVLQDNISDWWFLWERAHRISYRVLVEGDELRFEQYPTGSPKTPVLEWGRNLIEFYPCVNTSQQVSEAIVRGWDPKDKKEIIGRATKTEDLPEIGAENQGGKAAEKAFSVNGKEVIDNCPVTTQAEADALAQAALNARGQDYIIAEGVCSGSADVAAGTVIELKGIGNRFSGKYRVSRALHRYNMEGYITEFTICGRRGDTLLELLKQNEPEKRSPMIGIVTDNKDPDGLGRVKVKLPSRGNQESDWARMVSPGAGKDKGLMWLPNVDDEVLVVFEHEDMHRPFVLGGLWNQKDTPTVTSGNVVDKGKVTNVRLETAGKNYFIIIDESNKSSIQLGSDKAEITLDQKEKLISIRSDGDMTISGKTDMHIKSDSKIVIEAPQIEMKASGKISLKGAQIEIKADANMDIEAGAAMNTKSSGNYTIKGAIVQIN